MIYDEVFNDHFRIGLDTFKVVFSVLKGKKIDAGLFAPQILEITKLGDNVKYLYTKEPSGFDGKITFVLNDGQSAVTWSDQAHRELFNAINNHEVPRKFLVNPNYFSGVI